MMPARTQSVPQDRGAVAQRTLAGQVVRRGLERRHLAGDAMRAVGIGKVGHQRDLAHLRQCVQARPGGAEFSRAKAQAVHAAVQLQEHALRLMCLVRCQPIDLGLAVHRVPQVQARTKLQVARVESPFKQQDRPAPAESAQPFGLGQVEQSEAVGAAQPREGMLDAMAIGVGLDHRPDARIGRRLPRALQVVRQRIGVDQGFDRSRHRGFLHAPGSGHSASRVAPRCRQRARAITRPPIGDKSRAAGHGAMRPQARCG
jgi:hypothetical protein